MEIIKIEKIEEGDCFKKIPRFIEKGRVLVHPTETCYGVAASVFDEQALEKVYKLKEREKNKYVSVLVKDLEMAESIAHFDQISRTIVEKFWPGPLTLLLPRKNSLPDLFNKGANKVALRVSSSPFVKLMFDYLDEPITTTSFNLSGKEPMYSLEFERIKNDFSEDVLNSVVFFDVGELTKELPSTIVEVENGELKLVREGGLSFSDVKKIN